MTKLLAILLVLVLSAAAACSSGFPRNGYISLVGESGGTAILSEVEVTSTICVFPPDNFIKNPDGSVMYLAHGTPVEVLGKAGCPRGKEALKVRVVESGMEGWIVESLVELE